MTAFPNTLDALMQFLVDLQSKGFYRVTGFGILKMVGVLIGR